MARRDVDLVIKARNEASNVLQSITKALDEFVVSQRDLDRQADRSDSALGKLGAAFGRLRQQTKTLDFGQTIQQESRIAQQAVDRLENALANSGQELAQYERRTKLASAAIEENTRKLRGAEAAQNRYKASIGQLAANQKQLTRDLKDATASQARLSKEYSELPGRISRTSAAYASAQDRVRQFRDALIRAAEPSRTLQQNYERATASVDRNAAKLVELRGRYNEVQGELRETAQTASQLEGALNSTTSRLERQRNALGAITQNVRNLKTATSEAEKSQSDLAQQTARVAQRYEQTAKNLAEARREMGQTIGTTEQLAAAQSKLAGQARGEIVKDLGRQRQALAQTRDEWKRLEGAIAGQRREIAQAGVQTREQAENLAFLELSAREAKTNTELLERALREQLGVLRQSRADTLGMAEAQERLAAIQSRLGQALRSNATSTQQQANALRSANGEYQRARDRADRLADAARRSAEANRQNAQSTRSLAAAWREFYGGSRQSLGLLQRIRGEVLSLAAAYGGLFQAINIGAQSLGAIQTLEAANARLTVATGSAEAAERELDFLRRTTDRLGIQFGLLSDEYSKFAIATQSSNIDSAQTREIFLGIAEAARVNRTSTAQLSGVFTALTQIVSKGAVQQEELRQQLGDRLPGALQIMADALGITTAELVKMTEQGQLTEEALIPFARELRTRFGGGLDEALNSITASLGRLQNAAFQALAAFAQAGFADAIQDIADSFTETLQSADFRAFIESISGAVAGLIRFVQFATENFRALFAILAAFAGIKFTRLLIGIGGSMLDLARNVRKASTDVSKLDRNMKRTVGTFGKMRVAAVGLSGALGALLATGAGLAVGAIAAGIALWSTRASDATQALVEHQRQVDIVKNAYEAAGRDVDLFAQKVEGVTLSDLQSTGAEIKFGFEDELDNLDATLENLARRFNVVERVLGQTGASRQAAREVAELNEQYRRGAISLEDFAKAADDYFKENDDGSRAFQRVRRAVLDSLRAYDEYTDALDENALAQEGFGDSAEDSAEALDTLVGAMGEAALEAKQLEEALSNFDAALAQLQGNFEKFEEDLDQSNGINKLREDFEAALTAARAIPDAIQRIAAEQRALEEFGPRLDFAAGQYSGSAAGTNIVDRIIGVESGGRANAKNPNSTATGLGQFIESTWLDMLRRYERELYDSLDRESALALRNDPKLARLMVERYVNELAASLAKNGLPVNDGNIYLSYFLGPGDAQKLLRADPNTPVSSLVPQSAINANQSILGGGRTAGQVIDWAREKVGLDRQSFDIQQRTNEVLRERAEENEKERVRIKEAQDAARQAVADEISDLEFKNSIAGLSKTEQEIANTLREQELALREQGLELTQQERDAITQGIIAKNASRDAEAASNAELERAQEQQAKVNALIAQREAILKRIELAEDRGDKAAIEELNVELEEVTTQLDAAREKAIQMWEAIGGADAQAQVQQLRLGAEEAQKLAETADKTKVAWDRVGDLFANGLTNAFMSFAQAVAEGEDAGKAAREAFLKFAADFLIQIAQMIIRAAIFRALTAAFGGTPFGGLIGIGTGHTGGLVGSKRIGTGNSTRQLPAATFAFARRFHEGGIPGLKPGEVPAVLKANEEVLTRDDPRHMLNGGGMARGGAAAAPTIINAVDGSDALEQALSTSRGGEILMNYVRAQRTQFRAALEE